MIDVDRKFVELGYLACTINSDQKEYMESVYLLPPPWSILEQVPFKASIKELQLNMDKWNERIETLQEKTNRTRNEGDKAALFFCVAAIEREHEIVISNARTIINEANEYFNIDFQPKSIYAPIPPQTNFPSFLNKTTFIKTATSSIYEETVKVVTSETAVIDNSTCRNRSFNTNQTVTTVTDVAGILKSQEPPISTIVNYQLKLENCDVEISLNQGSSVQKEFQRQNKFDKSPSSLTSITDVTVERNQETLKKCVQNFLLLLPDHLTVMVGIPPDVVFKQNVSGVQKEFQRQNKYDRPPSTLATVIDAIVDPRQEKLKQCPQDLSILNTKCLPSVNMIENLLSVKQDVTATDTSKYKQEYSADEIEQQIQIPSIQKLSRGTKVFANQSNKAIHIKTLKRQQKLHQLKQQYPKLRSFQQRHCKVNEHQTSSTFWSRECLVKHSKKLPELWLEKICITLKEILVHSETDELKDEFAIKPKLEYLKLWKDKPPEILLNKTSKKDEQQKFVYKHATEEIKIDLESATDPDHSISCRRECREERSRICIIRR